MVRDRRRIVGLIKHCLTPFENPAVITGDDVTMLADLRMRRLARQWARLHCGLRGGETMARYQLTATELALACDRVRCGQLDQAAFDARRDSSLQGMGQAAAVLGPGRHVGHGAAAVTACSPAAVPSVPWRPRAHQG
jgi:hypothetical protein